MFENDSAKTAHNKKHNKNRKYDFAEMESRKSEDAYKRFLKKPYYLEETKEIMHTGMHN